MIIADKVYTLDEVRALGGLRTGYIKGVVDVRQGIVALDAAMHYQLAERLKESRGSQDEDLWGFRLWVDGGGPGEVLEFNSMINTRGNMLRGYPGEFGILDPDIEALARAVIGRWVEV